MLQHEPTIRLMVFLSMLILMMMAETWLPRRKRVVGRGIRTLHNLLLVVCNTVVVRLLPLLSAVAAASWATEQGYGLLQQVALPAWAKIIVSLILLDFIIYWQHVLTHRIPLLWKLHKVHHADLDLDATTGLRFHSIEIVFSMGLKCISAILLGIPPEAVLLFEIILNASAIFNHANFAIPINIDYYLRWLIVTPDMHRVHHSIIREETDSNFGFNLPWWDWLFKTYRVQPQDPHESLTLGLAEEQSTQATVPVWKMLMMPFRRKPSAQNRQECNPTADD